MLIYKEFEELCEFDIDTNSVRPILDPATIIVNIISKEDIEICKNEILIKENSEININSNLRSIKRIFFCHQHILKILRSNMDILKLIKDFSISKIDIFYKLFRTFDKISFSYRDFFYN